MGLNSMEQFKLRLYPPSPREIVQPLPRIRGVMTEWMYDPTCDDRSGRSTDPTGQVYDVGGVEPLKLEDIELIRGLGANTVRCSVEHGSLEKADEPGVWIDAGFDRLAELLGHYNKLGLRAIIDLHNTLGRAYGGDRRLWHEKVFQDRFVGVWEEIVRRVSGHDTVIAYEPLNEPEPPPDARHVWNKLAKRVTHAIRKIDADKPIIIDSIDYANPAAFAELEPTGDANTWYSFHWYGPSKFHCQKRPWIKDQNTYHYPDEYDGVWWDQQAIRDAWAEPLAFREEHGVRLFCGEFGCVSECPPMEDAIWLLDVVGLFDELQIDWTYFHFMFRTADPMWKDRFDCNVFMRDPRSGSLRPFPRKVSLLNHLLKRRGAWVDLKATRYCDLHASAIEEPEGRQQLWLGNRSPDTSLKVRIDLPEPDAEVEMRRLHPDRGFEPTGKLLANHGTLTLVLEPLHVVCLDIEASTREEARSYGQRSD